ncbi:hypothetical protein UMM65_14880 [Aureibaculum sp. 2210JD6-5]|uniref:hypothetical protein n=1 Tax=Aureibaculum sp. 2210JD6-5 TaxID=3103957 RepID=UPI002AACDC1C|nr:hypothetical protein [Aureibaculum sp. 2210JD6-5]MDY7396534.1 hypothetical protein [Aureibaculum sp. 2210JD6-5]
MHKKLEAELVSLAHSILQMKNRDEALALQEKARLLYEKLSVLAFVDDYVATTPNLQKSKEQLISEVQTKIEKKSAEIPVVNKPEPSIIPIAKPVVKPLEPKKEVEEKKSFRTYFR